MSAVRRTERGHVAGRASSSPCPSCGAAGLELFHEQRGVPVHSCRLVATRDEALSLPARRPAARASARACGFITNTAFDGSRAGLRRRLRGDAGLLAHASASSPTTSRPAGSIATTCAARRSSRSARGKGEFLVDDVRAGRQQRRRDRSRLRRGAARQRRCRPDRVRQGALYDGSWGALDARRRRLPAHARAHRAGGRVPGRHPPRHRRAPGHRRALRAARTSSACCGRPRSGTSTTSTARTSAPARSRGCSDARASRSLELELDYDDQYIVIEARPTDGDGRRASSRSRRASRRWPRTSSASARHSRATTERWRGELGALRAPTAAVPSCGARARRRVAFLTTLGVAGGGRRRRRHQPVQAGQVHRRHRARGRLARAPRRRPARPRRRHERRSTSTRSASGCTRWASMRRSWRHDERCDREHGRSRSSTCGRATTPLAEGILADIAALIESNAYINGPAVAEFEREFADFCGSPYAVGLASGLDALAARPPRSRAGAEATR